MPLRKALLQSCQCSNVPYWKLRSGQVIWRWKIGLVKQNSWDGGPDILTACISEHFRSDRLSCDPVDWMSVTGWSVPCVALEHTFQFSSSWKKHRLCTPRPWHEEDHLQNHTHYPYQNAFRNVFCLYSSLFPFLFANILDCNLLFLEKKKQW